MVDEELKQALAACRVSTKVTAKTLFPDTFNLPFCKEHDKIFELIDDESRQQVAIAAPRAFGKSSLLQKAFLARKILFQDSKYNVPVSASNTLAVNFAENLKIELTSNVRIKELFGDLESGKWSREMWITSDDVAIFPRGSGQQIRGINFRDFRPNIIIVDDLETKEGVMNEDTRAKLKEWFFTDLMQSVDIAHGWRVVVIGTLLHEASLLKELLDDDSWASVEPNDTGDRVISIAKVDTLESNWPELRSDEDIQKDMKRYRDQGILDQWYMELMNMVVPAGERCFNANLFRYYEESKERLDRLQHIETAVIVDPAKTTNPNSAESGIVVVSIDRISNRIFIREALGEKLHPDILINKAIDLAKQYKATALGVEVTSLEKWIRWPIENELNRRGVLALELVPLKAVGKKEDRVAGLIPLYRRGLIYHNKGVCNKLEAQLMTFPRSKRWDIMDALAYAPALLEEGGRYMWKVEDYTLESGLLNPDMYEPVEAREWCTI
jgi:hypothetical protein